MASLITCPHCGVRPMEEFTVKGDASLRRPAAGAGPDAWYDYVYTRDNPRGRHAEFWHHGGGCRRWLVVERDTLTHEVHGVRDAAVPAGEGDR
jgi:methylglutamate dehydrogenase subunit B